MKHTGILTIIVFLTGLFISCEKDINFSGEITDPLMVVNSFVTPDSLLAVSVTESNFFLSSQSTFTKRSDASVNLYINGEYVEQLNYDATESRYISSYRVQPGDLVRLDVSATGLQAVTSTIQVPDLITIESLDTTIVSWESYPYIDYIYTDYNGEYTYDTLGWSSYYTIDAKLRFQEPSSQKNYYRLVIQKKVEMSDSSFYTYDINFEQTDLVFGNESSSTEFEDLSSTNTYAIFTDELINGKTYDLSFGFGFSKYENIHHTGSDSLTDESAAETGQSELIITLQSISESYYLYLKTVDAYSSYDLFAEPVQIYSNITGGIGLLAGYSSRSFVLTLTR